MTSVLLHEDGSGRGSQAATISLVFSALGFIFVALRMYTRGVIVRNIGPEDWIIVASWFCALGLSVAIAFEASYGNGHHIWNIKPEDIVNVLKSLYASIIPYQTGLGLTKISILWQYHRIFPDRSMRMTIYVMIAVSVAYIFVSVLDNAFMCSPVALFWDKSLQGKCLSQQVVWFLNASINIVTDIIIFLMPMPALRKLQLPRKQKIGLIVIFALGGLVCVVSILRLPELYALTRSADPTFDNGPIAYWSAIELNVAIICACLPTLKAFAALYFPKLIGQSTGGYGGGDSTRKSTNVNGLSRKGGNTVTEVEHYDKNFDGRANQIQVVTVVEQGREDASSDGASPNGDRMMSKGGEMV